MKNTVLSLLCAFLLIKCTIPCPPDKKIGTLNFSDETKTFFPVSQQVNDMVFENIKGEQLIFKNRNPQWNKRGKHDVETLCEKGGFLDNTVQSAYYDTESINLSYINGTNTHQQYNLDIQIGFNHLGNGSKDENAFFETVNIWGQYLLNPTASGGSYIVTNTRGNDGQIPNFYKYKRSRMIADTVIINQRIKNAFITPDSTDKLIIFYTQEKGIEAFTTPQEAWVRKF